MLRIILFLVTAGSLFLTGCSAPEPPAVFGNGIDSYTISLDDAETLKPVLTGSFDLRADTPTTVPAVFAADCRGSDAPEIILIADGVMRIFSIAGEKLLKMRLPERRLIPAFTADADSDGKQDIVFGSKGAIRNEIRVINGTGVTVSRFRADSSIHDFSSITPQFIHNGKLFAAALPKDVEAPRGILCLNTFGLKPRWTFYCPAPVSLSLIRNEGKETLVPSYVTDYNGVFKNYGPGLDSDYTAGPDYGLQGMLLTFDTDGSPVNEIMLFDNADKSLNILEYTNLPETPEQILLIRYLTYEYSADPSFQLYKINLTDGRIEAESSVIPGLFLEERILPAVQGTRILISSINQGSAELRIFNSDLSGCFSMRSGTEIIPGPVITDKRNQLSSLYYIHDGALFSLAPDLSVRRETENREYQSIVYSDYGDYNLILYRDNSMDIFSLLR